MPGERCSFCASPSANPAGPRKRSVALRGRPHIVFVVVFALALTAGAPALAQSARTSGGTAYGEPVDRPTVAGTRAKLIDGVAHAPQLAPPEVQQAIWAANELQDKPYVYGGGHNRTFRSRGYDCSGTVSYALHGGGLLDSPLDSSSFMRWGERGRGKWITVYTNPGHAFVVVAGLRLDTSAANDPRGRKGPRWRPKLRSTRGYRARHPEGF